MTITYVNVNLNNESIHPFAHSEGDCPVYDGQTREQNSARGCADALLGQAYLGPR